MLKSMSQEECDAFNLIGFWQSPSICRVKTNQWNLRWNDMQKESKINIKTRRSTTLKQRVILVQGPCWGRAKRSCVKANRASQRCHVIVRHSSSCSRSLYHSNFFICIPRREQCTVCAFRHHKRIKWIRSYSSGQISPTKIPIL